MAAYDGTIRIDSQIDPTNFNKGVSGISSGLSGLMGVLGKLAAVVGITFSVGVIVNFLKQFSKIASDLQVLYNRFGVIFGNLAGTVEAKLTAIGNATNFCEHDLMDLATHLQVAFLNLGYTSATAANTSITAIKRVQDLATFWGDDINNVSQAIQMGMMGMTRGLRQYNVVIDENKIKAEAQALKLWDGAGAMSAQAKAAATLQIILNQTSYAQGNAEKTAHTWAGEVRGLAAAWEEFKAAIGNVVVIFAPIVAVVKTIVVWLTVLANEFAALVAMIFGIQVGTNAATAGIQGAADATGDLADNTAAAGKAAKGALASFDELNVLAQATGAGAGTTPSAPAPGVPLPVPNTSVLDAVQAKVKAFYEALMAFLAPAIDAFDRLKAALESLGETIWAGLKWAWDNILVPLGNWTITNLLPTFLDLLAAAATLLNIALIALQPLGQWLWDTFLKPLAEWTGGVIISVLQDLTKALYAIGDWIKTHQEAFQNMVIILGSFALAWLLVSAALAVYSFAAGVAAAVTTFLSSPILLVVLGIGLLIAAIILCIKYWPQISAAAIVAWNWIKATWERAASWFQLNVIDPIINYFTPSWNFISSLAITAYWTIVALWTMFSSWFQINVINPVSKFFKTAWENIKTWASDAWTFITGIWIAIEPWVQKYILTPVEKGAKAIINSIAGVITGIYNYITGILYDISFAVWNMVAGIIRSVDSALAKLSQLSGVTVPSIPVPAMPVSAAYQTYIARFATGGVIPPNAAFLAMLGDQSSGKNIEAPEALIRQIVREETQGGQAVTIKFAGSLGELVRQLRPYIDRENARIGTSLITQGVLR